MEFDKGINLFCYKFDLGNMWDWVIFWVSFCCDLFVRVLICY